MMAHNKLLLLTMAGPPASWAERLLSGCVALCPVGGRARWVGNDLELVIIIVMTTDAPQIGEGGRGQCCLPCITVICSK